METTLLKIFILFTLVIVLVLIQTTPVFADSISSYHVVYSVGPNNAIVSSIVIGSGALIMMILDKLRKDESQD